MSDDTWFFGRLFDFDGDGKTTSDEAFLAYMMWEEAQKKAEAKKQNLLFIRRKNKRQK